MTLTEILNAPLSTVEPLNPSHARTLARIAERALTLEEDGYKLVPADSLCGREEWHICKPEDEYPTYIVVLNDPLDGDYCDCPAWSNYGECKHRLAVLFKKAVEAANP